MLLKLKRRFKGPKYTIGSFFVNNEYFCDTIEDVDRGLKQSMNIIEIQRKKVKCETAIPTGIYNVNMDIVSPKYSKVQFYKDKANGGRVPRLINVKGFDGILIHSGNTEKDTEGCLIVGENKVKGQVINSRITFEKLYKLLYAANKKGEPITIEII